MSVEGFLSVLYIIGFTITGYTILLLSLREKEGKPYLFSIALLTLWCIRFFLLFIREFDLSEYAFLYIADQSFYFLDGLLLWWYSKSLGDKSFTFNENLLHLIPFLLASLLTILTLKSVSNETLYNLSVEASLDPEKNALSLNIVEIIFMAFIIISNLSYSLLSIRVINQYKKGIYDNLSTLNGTGIDWLSSFMKAWIIFMTVPVLIFFLNYLYPVFSIVLVQAVFTVCMVILAFYASVGLLSQKYVKVPIVKNEKLKPTLESPSEKRELFLDLELFIQEKQPYLQTNLTLKNLADELDMNPAKLSRVINQYSGKNFHEYINFYRVEAVKSELVQSQDQVIQIAYSNGFNSKSTFNEVFKKATGQTPSQYRKQTL